MNRRPGYDSLLRITFQMKFATQLQITMRSGATTVKVAMLTKGQKQ